MNDFTSTLLHQQKRSLSLHEKSSLPAHDGLALLLPGTPGGEVDELVREGYALERIVGVEQDLLAYQTLQDHYLDSMSLIYGDIDDVIQRSQREQEYSYIHLDYCCCYKPSLLKSLSCLPRLLRPSARVRISWYASLRTPEIRTQILQDSKNILQPLLDLGRAIDPDNEFCTQIEDTTSFASLAGQVLAATFFTSGVIGSNDEITDPHLLGRLFRNVGVFLPELVSGMSIHNLQRYDYQEHGNPNSMSTLWFDVSQRSSDTSGSDPSTIRTEVMDFLQQLASPHGLYSHQEGQNQ